jgi:predicted amidohydrolase
LISLLLLLSTVDARADESPATASTDRVELGVAVAQPLVVPGDVKGNIDRMQPLIAEAARQGARLVVFSECGITGYDLKGKGAAAALKLDAPALNRVSDMAGGYGVVIVAGLFERLDKGVHNTAVAFFPDGHRVVQRKHNVLEPERRSSGTLPAPRRIEVFTTDGFRCAMVICSDSGLPGLYDKIAEKGCHVVILITAGAGSTDWGRYQHQLAQPKERDRFAAMAATCLSKEAIDVSIKLNLAQVACNQMGWVEATGYFHPGGSSIVDSTGEVTAVIPPRFVFEHLRPDLDVGTVSREKCQTRFPVQDREDTHASE